MIIPIAIEQMQKFPIAVKTWKAWKKSSQSDVQQMNAHRLNSHIVRGYGLWNTQYNKGRILLNDVQEFQMFSTKTIVNEDSCDLKNTYFLKMTNMCG